MEKKELQVSPFLVFFLIHSVQVGVGVLGFQRTIIESAGNDAWMAVIAAAIPITIIIWIMYLLLNKHQTDLVQIHKDLFGKWIGGFLSLFWVMYWILVGVIVLRSYIEIVQVWVFPLINMFMFSLILLILVLYCVTGGFRIVAGISFLGVVIPFYIFITFIFPIEYIHLRNLLPVWNHSVKDLTVATKDMMFSYLGFSVLLMFYPHIKHPEKSQKWAHFGNLFTAGIYLFIIIITIGFYSENQVSKHIWATLSIWKIIELPFVERFEYIGITSWVLIILPNLCLSVWASTKGVEKMFHIKPRKAVAVILLIILFATVSIESKENVEMINKYMSMIGVGLVFIYVPILTLLSFLLSKMRREKVEKG